MLGQSIFVDLAVKLVVVQTGVNATPSASDTSLSRERYAFWRGILRQDKAGGECSGSECH